MGLGFQLFLEIAYLWTIDYIQKDSWTVNTAVSAAHEVLWIYLEK